MAINTTSSNPETGRSPFDDLNSEVTRAIDQVKSDVDELIAGLDLQSMTRRVEDFGRSNPMGLAFAALAVGVAAGLLLRRTGPAPRATGSVRPVT